MKIASLKTSVFRRDEGPFVRCLDEALASFNVQRQAYYSGSFIGNHVHRSLKVIKINVSIKYQLHSPCKDPCPPRTINMPFFDT